LHGVEEVVINKEVVAGSGAPVDVYAKSARDDRFGNPGDGSFNTVSLVEAADTPPFFHNNSAATLEEAIEFYTTDFFGNSDAGSFGGAFNFTQPQIERVAAFLRAINAIDNARNALAVANDARRKGYGLPPYPPWDLGPGFTVCIWG
jgi:cytochrome c peroxidase